MLRVRWAAAAAGALVLLAGSSSARADDVLRLNGEGDAKTMTLGFDGQASTQLVHRGWGGYHGGWGGYRGGWGGYHGGWGGYRGGWGGWGGYRGGWGGWGYGGWGRGWGYGGFYRPYYAGFGGWGRGLGGFGLGLGLGYGLGSLRYGLGYGGYGWGGLYGGYSGYPGYGVYGYGYPIYSYGGYGYPISTYGSYYAPYGYASPGYYGISTYNYVCPPGTSVTVANPSPSVVVPDLPPAGSSTYPPATQPGGTYPYDGGPANPVPLPKVQQTVPLDPAQPAPAVNPRRPAPAQGLFVSYPPRRPTTGFAYPAYGEDTRATSFGTARKTAPARSGR